MKYVCKICGYVYDDDKQSMPFAELPEAWVCPLCGAAKSDFEAQGPNEKKTEKPKVKVEINDDMRKLSVGELSAVCSNLARGCEKQYKQEESELFTKLAKYFADITPAENSAEAAEIAKLLQKDLTEGYENAKSTAGEKRDRGALRVCAWGEKVTRILNTLVQKYEKEGEAFLENTEVWVCTVCGFVFVGDRAPELAQCAKYLHGSLKKLKEEKGR